MSRQSLARARQTGFSLVEVVLAVGVISFAFVAIMGLLPAGLTQFRQAMDNSVGAQISQRVILECQQTDFDTLVNPNALATPPAFAQVTINARTVRYFDEQGNEITPVGTIPNAQEAALIIYHVNTRVASSTQLTESPGATDPTTGAAGGLSYGVATIVVQVAFNPSGQTIPLTNYLFDVSAPQYRGVTIKTYSAQVGRND